MTRNVTIVIIALLAALSIGVGCDDYRRHGRSAREHDAFKKHMACMTSGGGMCPQFAPSAD